MKQVVVEKLVPMVAVPKGREEAGVGMGVRAVLGCVFFLARRAPWLLRAIRPIGVWGAMRFSTSVVRGTSANARRILGAGISAARQRAFGAAVVRSFYNFVMDVGQSSGMTAEQLHERIAGVEGREAYVEERRRRGGGAIILTAHMGSFEVGLAALAAVEPVIHVVYKRDAMDGFETVRRELRKTLGVREAAIDEGWDTWMGLRDALERNEVVVMQADRAMPGQKAQAVPMFGGHLMLPIGPVKLAQISGSPLVPVFAVRTNDGRCRLFAEPAIEVDPEAELVDGVHPALLEVGKVIEKYVRAYPEQWLVLEPAFVEDAIN